MPASRSHRVFRCTLEVLGVSAEAAATWRHRLRTLWSQEFSRRLETELDAAFPDSNGRVRLRHLEIEVSVGPEDPFPDIGRAFQIALQDRLTTARASSHPTPNIASTPGTTPSTDTTELDDFEVWLMTGLSPWWADKPDLPTLRSRWLDRLRTAAGPSWLRACLAREPRAARRLALQFDSATHRAALLAVWPDTWPGKPELFDALERLAPAHPATVSAPDSRWVEFWETCWRRWTDAIPPSARPDEVDRDRSTSSDSLASDASKIDPLQALLRAWISPTPSGASSPPHPPVVHEGLPKATTSDSGPQAPRPDEVAPFSPADPSASSANRAPPGQTSGPTATARPRIEASTPHESPPPSPVVPAPSPPPDPNLARSPQRTGTAPPESMPGPSKRPAAASREEGLQASPAAAPRGRSPEPPISSPIPSPRPNADIGQVLVSALAPGLPVSQAGLVLVAVYLPRFFDQVGIRLSTDASARLGAEFAPLLLHFLATDQQQAPEHLLAFPKFLCGLPLDEPVACDHAFPQAFRDEAHQLLATVIRHWEALKNTSVPGLRRSFLQRPGLLRDTGPQWRLSVENRAWDMLIDRVPWGFRTLRLPWMPRPLSVEWNTYV